MRAPLDLAKSLLGVAGAVEAAVAAEDVAEAVEAVGAAEGVEAALAAEVAGVAEGVEAALAAEVADAKSTGAIGELRACEQRSGGSFSNLDYCGKSETLGFPSKRSSSVGLCSSWTELVTRRGFDEIRILKRFVLCCRHNQFSVAIRRLSYRRTQLRDRRRIA
jgi:hypothetical protein